MISNRSLRIFGICLVVFGGGTAAAQEYQTPVTGGFFEGEVSGNGMINPVFRYRWYVEERGGQIAICGIGHLRDAGVRSTIRRMARSATFYLNDETFVVDVSYFSQANGASDLLNGTATCRSTNIPSTGGRVGLSYGSGTHRD